MFTEKHPVGFKKYILIAAFGYRLRLHVWRGVGNDSRHNHRWWFVSVPLIGTFEETRFREHAGQEFAKISVLDESGRRDGGRLYQLEGTSDLEVVRVHRRYPLIPYLCRVGEIHSLVPDKRGLHASLVLVGRLQRVESDIWRYPENIDVPVETSEP